MLEVASKLNGTIWVFCAILIGLVLVQSFLFLRLALNYNKKYNLLSKSELSQAVRTGSIAAIGPSLSSLVVAISLMTIVGSATTYMRCGVIGAPVWELMMANLAATTAGVEFGQPGITENVFTLCLFGMILGSAPYFINTILTLKPLDLAVEKSKKSSAKVSFMPYLGNASMAAVLGYLTLGYCSSAASLAGFAAAMVICYIVNIAARKTGNEFLASCNLAIAMVGGMIVAQVLNLSMQG